MYNVGFLQNSNRGRGIISNDLIRGFKLIIIYNKFYLFIRISGEYVSVNQNIVWLVIYGKVVLVECRRKIKNSWLNPFFYQNSKLPYAKVLDTSI